jgi:deoxyribonuclease-4
MVYHVTELIGSLEYGALKKAKVIPATTMFTTIPKLGGKLPKLRNVDAWWVGYLVDRVIRLSLQNGTCDEDILREAHESVVKHTSQKQCSLATMLNDQEYYTSMIDWLTDELSVSDDAEILYEPEWVSGMVMGHPDLVIGDTIYDVKTTGRWGHMRIPTIFQLLSYAALARALNIPIKYIGVILPAQRVVEKYDVCKWDSSKFLELLQSNAREKRSCQSVDPMLFREFLVILPHIGSHVKREKTLLQTVAQRDPYQPIQIFLSGRTQITHKIADSDLAKSLDHIQSSNMKVFVHMPYTINIARLRFKTSENHIDSCDIDTTLIKHLETTASFSGMGAVVHIGSQVEMSYDQAMQNMHTNVSIAAAYATPECPLLIETDSGGSLLDNPEDLADFWLSLDESIRDHVAICVDTCHVFSAGYDNLDVLVMFHRKGVPVKLVHYNDSKFPRGSKKDRHSSFGKGLIGQQELIGVAKFCTAYGIPMVTE